MKNLNLPDANNMALRLDKITQAIALLGFFGLVALALLTFYDGTARSMNAPRLSGFSDYSEIIYPIVIASCFPASLLRQSNISVHLFSSIASQRVNSWIEVFAAFITLVFFVILGWQFIEMTIYYANAGRTSYTIEIPLAPWWWLTTAIMLMCSLIQFYVFASWLKAAINGRQPTALINLGKAAIAEEIIKADEGVKS